MSTSVIPFPTNGGIPDYLKRSNVDTSVFGANVSTGFPYLSVKGKVWTVVRDGERKVVANPKDPDSPATAISVVLLNANPNLSKVFYKGGYEDGSAEKPTCFSNDGIKPSEESLEKQCKTCAACPHNVWGSGEGGKGKACSDTRRVAVARADALDDPMLLRVPPASLKTLREHADVVSRAGVPMHAVVSKISFDPEQATPRLIFKPEGMLDEQEFHKAEEVATSDQVNQILGFSAAAGGATPAKPSASISEDKVQAAATEAKGEPTPEPTPDPTPEPKSEPTPEPAPKQEAKAEPEPKQDAEPAVGQDSTTKSDNGDAFLDELDDLLGGDFDD